MYRAFLLVSIKANGNVNQSEGNTAADLTSRRGDVSGWKSRRRRCCEQPLDSGARAVLINQQLLDFAARLNRTE